MGQGQTLDGLVVRKGYIHVELHQDLLGSATITAMGTKNKLWLTNLEIYCIVILWVLICMVWYTMSEHLVSVCMFHCVVDLVTVCIEFFLQPWDKYPAKNI